MSEANRVSIKSIAESTYGTTPGSGTWQDMRYTSVNLAGSPNTQTSNEIRSDRQYQDLLVVGESVGGDVGVELSADTYDEWLEAALCGSWTTDVLKIGTTERSFSLEMGFEDWTVAQYLQFKGMRVGGVNLNFPWGDKVTGGFSFSGKQRLESTTSLVGAGSTTAKTSTDILNGSSDISGLKIDGSSTSIIMKAISLSVNNNLRPIEGIGSAGPQNQSYGSSLVTGSIQCYFDEISLYQKLINNTSASLEWTVSDGTNSHTYYIPVLKFNDGNPSVEGLDTDVMQTLNFTALYDATDTALKITRA
jgi:hypothetical protein